jgi:hypothetical protein
MSIAGEKMSNEMNEGEGDIQRMGDSNNATQQKGDSTWNIITHWVDP